MPEPTIHVAVTAWKRPDCLKRTLESFWQHNRVHDFRLWFGLDGGQDPKVAGEQFDIFAAYGFTPLVIEHENVGCSRLVDHVVWFVAKQGDPSDLVLLLEDDWECVRPIPLGAIREWFNPDEPGPRLAPHGCIWLYGRFRERDEQGRPRLPVGTRHWGLPGAPEIPWIPAMVGEEHVMFCRAYWAHPPAVTRLDLAVQLTRGATDEKESFARSGRMDFLTAWLQDPVFWHIGRQSCWRDMGGKR